MKKWGTIALICYAVGVTILLAGICAYSLYNHVRSNYVVDGGAESGMVSEYMRGTDGFAIKDAKTAYLLGEAALRAELGDDVLHNRPFVVMHDEERDLWIVKGSSGPLQIISGGAPEVAVILDGKDGRIVSVYCEQF